jgi:NTE family protein
VVGIAWETGLSAGLAEGGIDLAGADLIVGTSAGSVIGAQLAAGKSAPEMLKELLSPEENAIATQLEFDLPTVIAIFQKWSAFDQITDAGCAEVGAMALNAKTMSEEAWLESFAERFAGEWPERKLVVTAVDAVTGAFQTWDRESGVPLELALASSCTVPGLFPAVSISGNQYIDGGVRSGTNADLAKGHETILIIAALGGRPEHINPICRRTAEAEAAALSAGGSHVELHFMDEGSLEAVGPNLMDPTRTKIIAEAGVEQGKNLAVRIADIWS